MARDEGRRRRRGGESPRGRERGGLAQLDWRNLENGYRPLEILDEGQIEAIHRTSLTILEEIGLKVLSAEARAAFAGAGFDVDDGSEGVRFERALVEELVAKAPPRFTLHARNPARNLEIAADRAVFVSVGGPAYCMDLDKGRRDGSFEEMCDFLRLCRAWRCCTRKAAAPSSRSTSQPRRAISISTTRRSPCSTRTGSPGGSAGSGPWMPWRWRPS